MEDTSEKLEQPAPADSIADLADPPEIGVSVQDLSTEDHPPGALAGHLRRRCERGCALLTYDDDPAFLHVWIWRSPLGYSAHFLGIAQAWGGAFDLRVPSPWAAAHGAPSVQLGPKAFLRLLTDYLRSMGPILDGGISVTRPPPPLEAIQAIPFSERIPVSSETGAAALRELVEAATRRDVKRMRAAAVEWREALRDLDDPAAFEW